MLIKEFIRAMTRLWALILPFVIVGLGAGIYGAVTTPRSYQAVSTMTATPSKFVLAQGQGDEMNTYPDADKAALSASASAAAAVSAGSFGAKYDATDSATDTPADKPLVQCSTQTTDASASPMTSSPAAAEPSSSGTSSSASPAPTPGQIFCDTNGLESRLLKSAKQSKVNSDLNSAATLVKLPAVKSEVMSNLGIPEDQDSVYASAVSIPGNSGTLAIWSTAPNQEMVLKYNHAFAKQLQLAVSELQKDDPTMSGIRVIKLSDVALPVDFPKTFVVLFRYLAIGLLLGLGCAALLVYLRNPVLSPRQVTEAFRLPAFKVGNGEKSSFVGALLLKEMKSKEISHLYVIPAQDNVGAPAVAKQISVEFEKLGLEATSGSGSGSASGDGAEAENVSQTVGMLNVIATEPTTQETLKEILSQPKSAVVLVAKQGKTSMNQVKDLHNLNHALDVPIVAVCITDYKNSDVKS